MNKNNNYMLMLMLLILACSPKVRTGDAQQIQLSASYTEGPVIKGLEQNPLIQVRIYVPAGPSITYTSIKCRLNEQAIKNIARVDLLMRDDKERGSLRDAKVLGSAGNLSANTEIPIKLTLAPGLHFIWLSPVLKAEANIDDKISIRAAALIEGNSEHKILTNLSPGFENRLGIAIRKAGDDGVNTYRIPGLIRTDKGTLVAVYDVRHKNSGDLPGNIDVGMNRSSDGGHNWEPMKIIMDMGPPHENNGVGDPAILFDPQTKKLWIAALWSKGNRSIAGSEPGLSPDITGQFVLVNSTDDGHTWSAPLSITSKVKNPAWHLYFNGPGSGISMLDGTLVFPSQYWDESRKPGIPHASVVYSTDHGNTWKSGTGAKSNTTESQVVETTPGTLMLNMRDNRGKFRSVATTKDMGKTWLEHPTSVRDLPDPVAMGSIIKARVNVKGEMKDVLFFSNVASQTARKNTTIKASLDLGETWLPANQLLLDSRTSYGYSILSQIDDHTIGILYEGERDLYFMRIPVKDIIKQFPK